MYSLIVLEEDGTGKKWKMVGDLGTREVCVCVT